MKRVLMSAMPVYAVVSDAALTLSVCDLPPGATTSILGPMLAPPPMTGFHSGVLRAGSCSLPLDV